MLVITKYSRESSRRDLHDLHTFVPWDSNLKTKKSASGKRPPDEAHGSGDETIRPQRSSEAERSSEKKVHHARCSDSASRGCTESKIYAYDAKHVPRWGNKHSAPQE